MQNIIQENIQENIKRNIQKFWEIAISARIGIYLIFVLYICFVYFIKIDGLRDFSGRDLVGRDFINFWSGGHAALMGDSVTLYNHDKYHELLNQKFGAPLSNYFFSYPPHSLLLFSPFGALPYVYGLIAWTLGGFSLAYAASKKWFKSFEFSLWIIIGPAALIALFGGQTGLWLAGIWMLALSLLDKRPILAGMLIGVLTVKPQMGVLLALFMLGGGHYIGFSHCIRYDLS